MSKTSAPPPPIATLAGRLKWVLDNRPFAGARELAEAAGVNRGYLRLLLAGERGAKLGPRAETARALAKAAGVPLAWLAGRPGLALAPAPSPAAAKVERWQGGGRRGQRQQGPEGVEFEGLAERLRVAYEQSGFWSQAAYAEAAGVSPNYLARLLSGDRGRRLPGRTAAALASAAGVRVRWLSTGEGAAR